VARSSFSQISSHVPAIIGQRITAATYSISDVRDVESDDEWVEQWEKMLDKSPALDQSGVPNFSQGCQMFDVPRHGLNSGSAKGRQGCCMLAGMWHCLPNLIVAGTQKSGTTALAAYLVQDRYLNFATSKEVHYFDEKRKTLQKYLTYFPPLSQNEVTTLISAEITPAYISHPEVCDRIQDTIPDPRVVLMLREPVDRAYSEVQMKQRRVNMQEDFKKKLKENSTFIFDCLTQIERDIQHTVDQSDVIGQAKKCIPPNVKEHGKYSKFEKEFAAVLNGGSRSTNDSIVMKKMFGGVSSSSGSPKKKPEENLRLFLEKCFGPEIPADSLARNQLRGNPSRKMVMKVSCFPKLMSEKIGDVNLVLVHEAQVLQICVDKILSRHTDSKFPRSQAVLECVGVVKRGISYQFIYRSLYAAQILACTRYLLLEQILVIENDELRNDPSAALKRIHHHAGLPPHHTDVLSADKIQSILDERFPDFEKISGWHLDSEYEDMSQETKNTLATFFAPFNEELYEMLGTRYPWESL
jgi:hypothetical protein